MSDELRREIEALIERFQATGNPHDLRVVAILLTVIGASEGDDLPALANHTSRFVEDALRGSHRRMN